MLKRWVILDRDGTLIKDEHYLASPEKVAILPGVVEGLHLLTDAGCRLITVTNQSGIGRGYFSERDMQDVNDRLIEMLGKHGIKVDGFFFCPHKPDDLCDCRKPKTGLVRRAAEELGFTMEQICCVIGDKKSDVLLAQALNCRTVLVLTGHGREEQASLDAPVEMAADFLAAARIVLDKQWMGA